MSIVAVSQPSTPTDSIRRIQENAVVKKILHEYMERAHPELDESMVGERTQEWKEQEARDMLGSFRAPFQSQGIEDELGILAVSSSFENVNAIEPENDQLPCQNENSIAINPRNPKNLIASAVDYRGTSSAWVYVSSDAGKSWKNINIGKPYTGWTAGNDPTVWFSADGAAFMCYGGFGKFRNDSNVVLAGQNGIFLARSLDEGKTWQSHIEVITHRDSTFSLDSTFEDKYIVHADMTVTSPFAGRVYIPWKRMTPRDSATQIVLARSPDGGQTWSKPVGVSPRLANTTEDTTYGQSWTQALSDPEGIVYVTWHNGLEHGFGLAKSTDGGVTFGTPKIILRYNTFGKAVRLPVGDTVGEYRHTVKGAVRAEAYPSMAVDLSNSPRRGTLYLSWCGDNYPNLYFSKSTDKGETWSAPKIVSSDTTNDQFWQWLTVDQTNGDLAISYRDSREDPKNILVHTYVAYSNNGGETWIDRRVSDEPSDIRRNPFRGGAFAGDYSGAAFLNGVIYPSWVDMRNTKSNIADNDVYTAIVKVRAPNPVENFDVATVPAESSKLSLTWKNPTERAFGQAMSASEFSLALYRDGVFNQSLASNITSLVDSGLMQFSRYSYSIRVVAGADTSVSRSDSAFAGGAKNPDRPIILEPTAMIDRERRDSLHLRIKLPTFRADGVTPLVNMKQLKLYRDGSIVQTMTVSALDTGKVITVTDGPLIGVDDQGYFKYSASVTDAGSPSNESIQSFTSVFYVGDIPSREWSDNFDGELSRYYSGGGWTRTNKFFSSSGYSMTESSAGKYVNNASDTLMMFPIDLGIITSNGEQPSVKFKHAAIIHRTDTGFVEASIDGGKNWSKFGAFNSSNFTPWQDATLDAADWKEEILLLSLDSMIGDKANPGYVLVRFRFEAGALQNSDGWYVDDLRVGGLAVGVGSDRAQTLAIYPMPVSSFLTIKKNGIETLNRAPPVTLSSVEGSLIAPIIAQETELEMVLDVRHLPNGVYALQVDGKRWLIVVQKD